MMYSPKISARTLIKTMLSVRHALSWETSYIAVK